MKQRVLLTLLVVLCFVLFQGSANPCLGGITDSMDKAIAAFDKAINVLNTQSQSWQGTLVKLEQDLIAAGQSTLANEVQNVMQRGIATGGNELRCNADFIQVRMRQALERIRARLKNQEIPPVAPGFCQVVPEAVDLRLDPSRRGQLSFYGYDFDVTRNNLKVIVKKAAGELDVTSSVAMPTHYLMTINVASMTFPPDSQQFIVRWGSDTLSTVNIILPAPPVVTPPKWESLGGVVTSGPGASSWSWGRLDVFARGGNNALYHKWYNGSWSAWESLGGSILSAPAAVSWGTNRIDVFALGTNTALFHKWFDGEWHDWESLGGQLTSAPAVASWGNRRLDVFARGAGDVLMYKYFDGQKWQDWRSLGMTIASAPAAVSWGSGRIDVFARGANNELRHTYYANGQWRPMESLGGTLTSAPAVASWKAGRLDVVAGGPGNTLMHRTFDNNQWGDWQQLSLAFRGDPGAVSWGSGNLHVFAWTPDNALSHVWYEAGWKPQ
jgi:hypothetical protein